MKAQLLGAKALQQQATDAKPQRVATGQHHRPAATSLRRLQPNKQGLRLVGCDQLQRRIAGWHHRKQPQWSRQQVSLVHQCLKGWWQPRQPRGIGPDHRDRDGPIDPLMGWEGVRLPERL